MPDGEFYTDAVEWAFDNGLTTGTTDTTFEPDDGVTRGQNVTFAKRYDDYLEDVDIPEPGNLYDQPGVHFGSVATRGVNDSLVGTIIAAIAGLLASQMIAFINAYLQRLGGHLDEARRGVLGDQMAARLPRAARARSPGGDRVRIPSVGFGRPARAENGSRSEGHGEPETQLLRMS